MIQLFLNNHLIQIDTALNIKLTRENPYISASSDYTFDVMVPLSADINRLFFGEWKRVDISKIITPYAAKLYVNNTCILYGTAKVTGVDKDVVKLQLFGDRSEFNAVYGDLYIDELDLPHYGHVFGVNRNKSYGRTDIGYIPNTRPSEELGNKDEGWDKFVFAPVYNESADKIVNVNEAFIEGNKKGIGKRRNISPQFSFLYTIKSVFKAIGYDIDISEYDRAPYNHMIIACCYINREMSFALPHWTIKEFLIQLQYFFGCTFIFSSNELKVKMEEDNALFKKQNISVIKMAEEMTMDVDEEESLESIKYSNLHYDISDSESNNIACFDKDKLRQLPLKEYSSFDEFLNEFNTMDNYKKNKYLFKTPQGFFCQWTYESYVGNSMRTELIRVNPFSDLIREEDADETMELKICPVAINEALGMPVYKRENHRYGDQNDVVWNDKTAYLIMPTMPGGEKNKKDNNNEHQQTDIQELLQFGTMSEKTEKTDRIELFFWNDNVYQNVHLDAYGYGDTIPGNIPFVYTAYDFKNVIYAKVEKWSFSMNGDFADAITLSRIDSRQKINHKQKYTIRFLSESIPNPADVFLINNKRFVAEKIEVNLKDGNISQFMTGFFYEISEKI